MSRPLRFDHAGGVWHVTARGNELKKIYRDDGDRRRWLELLGRTAEACNWRVYAYAQMGNHFHLVIETTEPTLSYGMRQLNGIYAQWFNRRHRRVGHLFQGRFHAALIDRENYLLNVIRYVVQNPVEAGMVARPSDWAWSSHRATTGEAPAPSWLDTAWTLTNFGGSRQRYAEFAERPNPSFDPSKLGIAIGDDRFRREVGERAAALKPDSEIPAAQRGPAPLRIEDLIPQVLPLIDLQRDELPRPRRRCRERSLMAHVLRRNGRISGRLIGPILGVSRGHASRLARSGRESWAKAGLPVHFV